MFGRHIQAGEHRQHIRPPGAAAAPFGVQRVADFAGELPPVEETQPLDEVDMGLEGPVDDYSYSVASRTAARIDTLRSIVQNGQHEEIDGMIVDLQTANLLIQIYEKGNDNTKNLIDTAPLEKVVGAAWKLTSGRTAVSLDAFEQEGYDAWHRDEPAAPAANKMVMDALEGASVGDRSNIEIMKAFSRGFERGRQEMMDREFPEMRGASRTAGTEKVRGEAQVGDLVTYHDMANQRGEVWEVVEPPEGDSFTPSGIAFPGRGYKLRNVETGADHWSDLRQNGWTFATDFDLGRNASHRSASRKTAAPLSSVIFDSFSELLSSAALLPEEQKSVEDAYEAAELGKWEAAYNLIDWVAGGDHGPRIQKFLETLLDDLSSQGATASRKTSAVTWYDQSDQFGGMWSTYQGSAPDSPNGQISESNGTYRWYVSDSGTRGNQQTGESGSLDEAKREAESALASLGITANRTAAGKCPKCDGMGRETYETDTGSLSTQTCKACGGTGQAKEAARKQGSRRTAFLDTVELTEPRHRVAGWNWDDHLNGFIAAEAAREFTCACGDNVPAPGYTDCRCGKRWNAYTISANGSKKMIAREVPVRENVVMARTASRRTAETIDSENLQVGDVVKYGDETITIIGEQEYWEDPFGRDMMKYMARSSDGREGYVMFGYGASLPVVASTRTATRKTAAGWNKGTHPDISDLSDEQLQDFIDNVQESIDAGANVGEIMENKRDRFEEELRSRGRKATRKIAAPSSGADAIAQHFPGWRVDDENGNFWEIQSPGGEHAFIHEEDGTYTVLTNDNTPDEFYETGLSFEDALAEVRAEGVI